MAFEAIPGQEQAASRLRAVLQSGRMPHAWLFVGSPGVGRLAMAQELAQVLLCGDRPRADGYCGLCASCILLQDGNHPDFHRTGIPEGRQRLPISQVQEIINTARLRPVRSSRRVFVVCDAQRMSEEAANCFLKTLEEPPGGCVIILIATGLRDLPETVISRCRLIRLPNPPPALLQSRLEADGMEPAAARWLARRCWGSPGLAHRCGEAELPVFNSELVPQLVQLTLADNFRLSDWLNRRASEGAANAAGARESLQQLLECVVIYYRDLALAAALGSEADLFNAGQADGMTACAAGHEPEEFVERAELVIDAMDRISSNANRSLALDNLFTQLATNA